MCKQYHCLPSQLENEDIIALRRMSKSEYIYDTFVQAGKNTDSLTKDQWELLRDISEQRRKD